MSLSGHQLPHPRGAHNLPGSMSWPGKPHLAVIVKQQEGLPLKDMSQGMRNTEWKLKLQKYDFQL